MDQSYRRGEVQIHNLTAAKLSLGQMWRVVMENEFFDSKIGKNKLNSSNFMHFIHQVIKEMLVLDPLHSILADATGFKLQRAPFDVALETKK